MEENYLEKEQQNKTKAVKMVNYMNGGVAALMLLLCFESSGTGGVIGFFIGGAFAIVNLILLIIHARKGYNAYIYNIIWMLLMPIIGFGCCASAFVNGGH